MMRWMLLGSLIATVAAAGAHATPPTRIPLDRVQDTPPERIDLIVPAVSTDGASSQRVAPDLAGREPSPGLLGPRLRSIAGVFVPPLLARTLVPLTQRTHREIGKAQKGGQLSKREARQSRRANSRVALGAWAAGADGRYTDYEARDVQGNAEAISAYVFERRFAPKIPEVTYPKDDKRGR